MIYLGLGLMLFGFISLLLLLDGEGAMAFGITMIIAMGAMITIQEISEGIGYKEGQIDAIQGKVKYQLTKQPDGSIIWTEKK
jgi:hypothetical protein